MIKENKFSKYLFYAIAEIILVVIGILIALSINNWNEDRKNNEKEIYYLNSIKSSIELSQEELERVLSESEESYKCADTLFKLLAHKKYDNLEGQVLDSLLFRASNHTIMSMNDGGLREVLNTGSLNHIDNEYIRIAISSHDERLHDLRKYEDYAKDVINRLYLETEHYFDATRAELYKNASVFSDASRKELYKNKSITNKLNQAGNANFILYTKYLEEKKVLDSLTHEINKELAND